MNYVNVRYVVSVIVGLPLVINGMNTQPLSTLKKQVALQKRSFFRNDSEFYKLIDNPQFSLVDVDELMRKEVLAVTFSGNVLCRSQVAHVQKKIVTAALKHKTIHTVLQDRFERVEKYDSRFNKYDSDSQYAYVLGAFHEHVKGKVCTCGIRQKSDAWLLAYRNELFELFDELKYFDEALARE